MVIKGDQTENAKLSYQSGARQRLLSLLISGIKTEETLNLVIREDQTQNAKPERRDSEKDHLIIKGSQAGNTKLSMGVRQRTLSYQRESDKEQCVINGSQIRNTKLSMGVRQGTLCYQREPDKEH